MGIFDWFIELPASKGGKFVVGTNLGGNMKLTQNIRMEVSKMQNNCNCIDDMKKNMHRKLQVQTQFSSGDTVMTNQDTKGQQYCPFPTMHHDFHFLYLQKEIVSRVLDHKFCMHVLLRIIYACTFS